MDNVEKLQNFIQNNQKQRNVEMCKMQHNLHKLTAKERILLLLDEGSFIEFGSLVKGNGDGVITGYGTIDSRLVFLYSQDYSVNGGAVTIENCKKISNVMNMAGKMGAPLIQIFDSAGTKLTEGLEVLKEYGSILNKNASLSGVVPKIAVVAGSCVGIAALNCTMSDFTIIVDECGEVACTSSDKLIKEEKKFIDKNMYADAANSSKNGSIQINVKNEKQALKLVEKIMDYIPSNNLERAPLGNEVSDLNIVNEKLNTMVKDNNLVISEIIKEIADKDSIIEINEGWGKNIITCLIKINGLTIGMIGNDSNKKSEIYIKDSDKISRFVRMCDSFNIPILSLVNTKGVAVSLTEEQNGLALYASKIIYSLSNARVPKVSLIIGDVFGAGYLMFASKETSFDLTLAWPSARISLTEPKTLITTMYRDEIIDSDNPKKEQENVIKKYVNEVTDPFKAAEKGLIDDIIMPSETKARIYSIFDMLLSKRDLKYPKKHDNFLI